MKKWSLILLSLVALLQGCSTDFEVAAEWEDITVVYGLLNQADTAHYIKINKAFLDKETSAEVVAQISDSLFYDSIIVSLVRLKDNFSEILVRVDGNNEGFSKEEGTFSNSPNWLYKSTQVLDETSRYRLIVQKLNDENLVTAETNVVGKLTNFQPIHINPDLGGVCIFTVWSTEAANMRMIWDATKNSKFYEAYLRFNYREEDNDGNSSCHSVEYKLFSDKLCSDCNNGSRLEFIVDRDAFYEVLALKIKNDPGVTRYIQCFDIVMLIGDENLYTFKEINKAQAGSIVQNSAVIDYTNIEGGRGLFASRMDTTIRNLRFGNFFTKTLADGAVTRDLNFVSDDECGCEYITPPLQVCPKD